MTLGTKNLRAPRATQLHVGSIPPLLELINQVLMKHCLAFYCQSCNICILFFSCNAGDPRRKTSKSWTKKSTGKSHSNYRPISLRTMCFCRGLGGILKTWGWLCTVLLSIFLQPQGQKDSSFNRRETENVLYCVGNHAPSRCSNSYLER